MKYQNIDFQTRQKERRASGRLAKLMFVGVILIVFVAGAAVGYNAGILEADAAITEFLK